jgi:translation initiation factor 1
MARDADPLVFSTDRAQARRCPRCGGTPCTCPPAAAIDPARTVLRVRLETSGRRGKAVTVVFDLPLHPGYWEGLLRKLKAHCATGGALKGDCLELQGDHRERARAFLAALGFTVRQAGG